MDLEEIESEIVDWIKLAQDRWGLLNMVITCRDIHTAHLIDNRHTKQDSTRGTGGTTVTSLKYCKYDNTDRSSAEGSQFLRIVTHLMMAE
jgi:hypothetical protein